MGLPSKSQFGVTPKPGASEAVMKPSLISGPPSPMHTVAYSLKADDWK